MSNLPQSDLILAGRFVDGDLPAQEAAQAESRIAEDADFASAVEQIRNQSSLFGQLPNFKPADDLADRTLQASMDQVKAIMGAWPIESDDAKTSLAPEAVASRSFDWKSTVALVASLAGVLMVGTMLWQGSQTNESNLAMSEAPVAAVAADRLTPEKSSSLNETSEMDDESERAIVAIDSQSQKQSRSQSVAKSDLDFGKGAQPIDHIVGEAISKELASSNALPGRGSAITGTRMKRAPAQQPELADELVTTNTATQVAQIWCVNQDSTAPKSAVCDILNSNEIVVQRDASQQAAQTPDAVEAFYVAATPKQMKLAMSQISNNADIEMIELPTGANSPIADAIQQQFAKDNAAPVEFATTPPNENIPLKFQPSRALGQHLLSNSFPRSIPGPVPPILKSGSPIEGLDNESSNVDLASRARSKSSTPATESTNAFGGTGMGGGGMGGGGLQLNKEEFADSAAADVAQAPLQQQKARQQTAQQLPQQAVLDKYLGDSEQLQQYLILVRGGEEKK